MGFFGKKVKEKKVIGFWAGENYFRFLEPIIDVIKEENKLEVRKFEYYGDDQLLKKQLKECDIAWFEWARGPIEVASKFTDINTPIICRLHKYEAYIDSPKNINWENVSTLLFISEAVKDTFSRRFPDEIKKTDAVIISNGIDLNIFKGDMKRPRGYKVAFNGRFHYHKSPELFLQCAAKLKEKNSKFKFYLIGEFIDPVIEEYFWYQAEKLKLTSSIKYDGVIDNVHEWFADKDYFLQPSIIEGQSVAALEAMACGLKPVLHDYYHSYKVFPKKYLFNTIDEAVKMITEDEFDREEYRKYVEKYNNLEKQIGKIKELINGLVNE